MITEIAFKLQAIPEAEATVVVAGLSDRAAVGVMARAAVAISVSALALTEGMKTTAKGIRR